MAPNASSVQSLRRVFREGFTAYDIAEPLASFDEAATAIGVKASMEASKFEVAGIRSNGLVVGYVRRDDLGSSTCAAALRSFDDAQVVLDSTPLVELVPRLNSHSRLFVSLLGRVGGIVSRSDLQKPPARMWLFGLVTLIEMRFTGLIEQFFPNLEWQSLLSEGRIRKAESLLSERSKGNEGVTLLDCLQLSDKATIVARSDNLRAITHFESKRQLESATQMLERLRNNLAHAQDIVKNDWETVVLLAERIDSILAGPTPEKAVQ